MITPRGETVNKKPTVSCTVPYSHSLNN